MTAIAYGNTCRDEKTWPAAQCVETPVSCAPHLHHFTANITCHQCPWELKAHPVLQYLNLDGAGAFTHLASHLKRDILQPQPIPQINPSLAPAVLPQGITDFLGISLGMSTDVIDDCWGILQNYVREYLFCRLHQGTLSCPSTLDGHADWTEYIDTLIYKWIHFSYIVKHSCDVYLPTWVHTRSFPWHQVISTLCRRKYMEDKYRENTEG